MTKRLAVFVMLVVPVVLAASSALGAVIDNGHMWFWADETGAPLMDPTIDAAPGDTVKAWVITNTNRAGWPGTYGWQMELWWDTAVIANAGSGDGLTYITPFYQDPAFTLNAVNGSEVTSPPGGNYDATPVYNAPQYAHYGFWNLWGSAMWMYTNMPVMGFEIPIRPDAPLGETVIGGSWNDLYRAYKIETIDAPDDWVLTINVIPEPATMAVVGLGGLAALLRRRRK